MGARELLADAAKAGFVVTATGDNNLLIRPASKLTADMREALRNAKPALLAELATRTCVRCTGRTAYGTCSVPVRAGLAPRFVVVWPRSDHASRCPAFDAKPEPAGVVRPYKLSPDEGNRAHAETRDAAACARFAARVVLFMRCGFDASDADDLAERLHLRDVDDDDRRTCIECRHFEVARSRCGCPALGRHCVGRDDLATLRRCPGFENGSGAGLHLRG